LQVREERELASLATVHKHIIALEAKNYLKRGFNQSRSLELTSVLQSLDSVVFA